MKKVITIAVLTIVSGLALSTGAVELSGLKAADIHALAAEIAVPEPSAPAERELVSVYYGNSHSVWTDGSQARASAELEKHIAAVKSSSCGPGLAARFAKFYEDHSSAYANRLITYNHYHLSEAAVLYSQKYGCETVDSALETAEGHLKETLSAREWTAIHGK